MSSFSHISWSDDGTSLVLEEVADERATQRQKWGNDHDDREARGTRDQPWHLIHQLDRRLIALPMGGHDLREMFVEVAALAVAAIETLDRLERERWASQPPATDTTGGAGA